MKFELWSIGKPHEVNVRKGIEEFTKRLNHYFKTEWQIIPPLKGAASLSEEELKKKEADVIMGLLKDDDYLVLLDERGKHISSEDLADFIQKRANSGAKKVIFLIGGAFGVDASVFKRADFTLSFSKFVFPHMLVRLLLAEQLYRACTILRNEKYHHQ